jgi:hypothetical protein
MDRPAPDPAKLLDAWMEWERGEELPGRVMSNLKTGGLRDLLEDLVAGRDAGERINEEEVPGAVATDSWTPVV